MSIETIVIIDGDLFTSTQNWSVPSKATEFIDRWRGRTYALVGHCWGRRVFRRRLS